MNAFRMTHDGRLDRDYMRVCAVYRCMKRFGMSAEDGIARMQERHGLRKIAPRMIEIWRKSKDFPQC